MSFCHLPAELRQVIFRLVLCKPIVRLEKKQREYSFRSSDVSTSLLRVCKVFHHEAAYILYQENTFGIQDYRVDHFTTIFCPTIGTTNASRIRSLQVDLQSKILPMKNGKIVIPACDLGSCFWSLPALEEVELLCGQLIAVDGKLRPTKKLRPEVDLFPGLSYGVMQQPKPRPNATIWIAPEVVKMQEGKYHYTFFVSLNIKSKGPSSLLMELAEWRASPFQI